MSSPQQTALPANKTLQIKQASLISNNSTSTDCKPTQSSRSPEFDTKQVTPLAPHTAQLAAESVAYINTINTAPTTIEKIHEVDTIVQKSQRQLKLLSTRLNEATEEMDLCEVSSLPILVDKCHDLEHVFQQIDSLYLLMQEIESNFDTLEKKCDEIEKFQGSSASKLKSMSLFFKSVLKDDKTTPQLTTKPDCVENLPKFDQYIDKDYVPLTLEEMQAEKERLEQELTERGLDPVELLKKASIGDKQ